jgi:hypothetical protein
MTAKSTTTAVKPARKGTVRTSNGKRSPVVTKSVAPVASKAPASPVKKAPKAKAPAKSAKATRPIPTPDAPLASGWVRQSLAPAEGAASKFTTQTQRRLLRAVVAGEVVSAVDLPRPTLRTLDRLAGLGFVTVAKAGKVAPTKAGREFVSANPAPRVRAPKAAPAPVAKAPKGTGRKVVRRAAKATA